MAMGPWVWLTPKLLGGWAVSAFLFVSLLNQVPVFKGRLDVVRTEVAVIDSRTGKAVTGLTESDFTVSENGVRQTISSFVDLSAAPADAHSAKPQDPTGRRVFLFVFDVGVNTGPYRAHDAVAKFVRTKLNPQDLVGVLAMTRLTELTTDHERVARIVERLEVARDPLVAAQSKLSREDRNDMAGLSLIDQWLEPNRPADGFLRDASSFLLGTTVYRQNDAADSVREWRFRLGTSAVLKVVAGIEFLRRVSGRKHLVLLTPHGLNPPFSFAGEIGLQFESADDDRNLAVKANEAGVAIDIVQTTAARFAVMSNTNLSEHSGGQFSSVRIVEQQLARISEGTLRGYILGHVPRDATLDNRYRSIAVTVNRKDVTLAYPRGYTATEAPVPISSQEVYTKERMRNAVAGNIDLRDLRVQASAVPVTEAGKSALRLDLKIDLSPLRPVQTDGRWTDEINLLIVCGDAKQNVIGKLDQHMTLSMTGAMYEQAKSEGIPYSVTIPLTGKPKVARIVAFNYGSDRLGTATVVVR